jgi:hypothetical protein
VLGLAETLDFAEGLGEAALPDAALPDAASAAVPAPSTTAAADAASVIFFNIVISRRKLPEVDPVDGAASRFVFGQGYVRVVFGFRSRRTRYRQQLGWPV